MRRPITINGELIHSIEDHFDPSIFEKLHTEAVRGLTKMVGQMFFGDGYEYSRGDAMEELYDHSYKDVAFAEKETTNDEKAFIESIDPGLKSIYLLFARGAYFPWFALNLFQGQTWFNRMKSGRPLIPGARENFPWTLDFLNTCGIFTEIGRICYLGLLPGHHATCHRDADPDKRSDNSEFIVFNPTGKKPTYVYDPLTKTKHYSNGKAYMFHDFNYHGADASPFFTYSIRVDGVFSDDFRRKIRIENR